MTTSSSPSIWRKSWPASKCNWTTLIVCDQDRSFTAGPLTMNFDQRRVTINGQEVDLTHTEYELLYVLVLNRDRIVTYDYLRSQVWDDEDTENNNIHAYINRLSKKIEAPCDHRFIYNEPKVGYRFETRGFTLFRNE